MSKVNRLLQRPRNFFDLPLDKQWAIDKELGILDLEIEEHEITFEDAERIRNHFRSDREHFQ